MSMRSPGVTVKRFSPMIHMAPMCALNTPSWDFAESNVREPDRLMGQRAGKNTLAHIPPHI